MNEKLDKEQYIYIISKFLSIKSLLISKRKSNFIMEKSDGHHLNQITTVNIKYRTN